MSIDRLEISAVEVGAIAIPEGRRAINEAAIPPLMESMAQSGLLNPIIIRSVPEYVDRDGQVWADCPLLVAGRHRLEAARRLGWREIECIVSTMTDDDAELAEIDENLMRAELTPAERAECMARRKAVWQRMQAYEASPVKLDSDAAPDAAEDGEGGESGASCASLGGRGNTGFAADTAAKTGGSKAQINRDVRRGEKIAPAIMARVKADQRLNKGTVLDQLAATPEAEQQAKLDEIIEDIEVSEAAKAAAKSEPKPPKKPPVNLADDPSGLAGFERLRAFYKKFMAGPMREAMSKENQRARDEFEAWLSGK